MRSFLRNYSTRELVEELFMRDDAVDVIHLFKRDKGLNVEFITVKEFKRWLSISSDTAYKTIKRAIATKAFTVIKIGDQGGEYRIDKVSFQEWAMKTGGRFQ